MKTASIIESCGFPDRIQCSEYSTGLIEASGKGNWLTQREGLVTAKGKFDTQVRCNITVNWCMLLIWWTNQFSCQQTYWLKPLDDLTTRSYWKNITHRRGVQLFNARSWPPLGKNRSIRFCGDCTTKWSGAQSSLFFEDEVPPHQAERWRADTATLYSPILRRADKSLKSSFRRGTVQFIPTETQRLLHPESFESHWNHPVSGLRSFRLCGKLIFSNYYSWWGCEKTAQRLRYSSGCAVPRKSISQLWARKSRNHVYIPLARKLKESGVFGL